MTTEDAFRLVLQIARERIAEMGNPGDQAIALQAAQMVALCGADYEDFAAKANHYDELVDAGVI